MATVDVRQNGVDARQGVAGCTDLEARPCFVITPMGATNTPIRKRAEEVYRDYIEPVCKATGYFPLRASPTLGVSITQGITNALNCAPMAIAYMGGIPWNPNVMIEIGYRMATKLPLVYLCDQDECGNDPPLPFHLQGGWVVALPVSGVDPDKFAEVVNVIRSAERAPRNLDCLHPTALINVRSRETVSTCNLVYTAASRDAEELFGDDDDRLVGLTMNEFLQAAKRRMPPAQFAAFSANQRQARRDLQRRMCRTSDTPAVARIPMYFDRHPVSKFNGRAFLPIILQDYTPENKDWYNLRVLYLDVTTVSKKATDPWGEEYYCCSLDPDTEARLDSLQTAPPRVVFISYSRQDRDVVEQVFTNLKECFYPEVDPWMDLEDLYAVSNFPEKLTQAIQRADHALIFFGAGGPGNGQTWEIGLMTRRLIMNDPKFRATAILLDGVETLPEKMMGLAVNGIVKISEIQHDFEKCLKRVLFPERCNG